MVTTIKKTTVVMIKSSVTTDGRTVETTETVTSASDGDATDAAEVEKAMSESSDALSHVFDGFSERMSKVFEPFDRLFKKKPAK